MGSLLILFIRTEMTANGINFIGTSCLTTVAISLDMDQILVLHCPVADCHLQLCHFARYN